MKKNQNATITFLLEATYEDNNDINIIYDNHYKVTFRIKGRVRSRNHRDLVDIREKIEMILAKHNVYYKECLFVIIELCQEEGLACMTNPKTTSKLYHVVLKCMYNDINYWRPHPSLNRIVTN